VLAGGEVTAELHYHAAVILAASAADDPVRLDRAAGHAERDVALGRNSKSLASDPVLTAHLGKHPRYQALAGAAAPAVRPAPPTTLLLMPPD
jgi:hypothetical protein